MSSHAPLDPRLTLLHILQGALAAVEGRRCVRAYLELHPAPADRCALVAIGKAGASMAQGAVEALGARVTSGLVITKEGHCAPLGDIECREAGHPFPDARSLAAGQRLLAFLDELPRDQGVVFLISGGASALVEVLPRGLDLDALIRANRWLVGSGWDIAAMNRARRALSCIKGGRLLAHLHGRPALNLLISDVPGDDIQVIGSGLLVTPREESASGAPRDPPAWLSALLARVSVPPASSTAPIETVVLASNREACQAAAEAGRGLGFPVYLHEHALSGDAAEAGVRLARALRSGPPGLHIWGGETTVRLPAEPGRGGRNQTLALAAAAELAGSSGLWLLAAGTDGSDGPTDDAGAVVDGTTLARGAEAGLDAARCLAGADAGTFLAASGDLIHTGPTGTNVMDLVLGFKGGTAAASFESGGATS